MKPLSLFVLLLSLWWSAGPAFAQCEAFTEAEFLQIAQRAQQAIDGGDAFGHGAVYQEMQERLPCLEEQLPRRAWAEFLVGLSTVEHALGREWESSVDTAVRVYPDVRRDYGPDAVRSYVPGSLPENGRPLVAGSTYFLDGVPITRARELKGLHVLQRLQGDTWSTRLLIDEPIPPEWIQQPEPEPEPITPEPVASVPLPPVAKRRGTALVVSGAVLAAIGAGTGIATWAMTPDDEEIVTEGYEASMKAANVVGWSLAGVGVGVGVFGVWRGQENAALWLGVTPSGLAVGGRL
ncbi:MAG: hypothetical protein JRI25_19580 [Deltaproteobacteria bacterium]|nr:hypothetical protein [Deltaproteobacteria bacterium]MBW2256777.1 hypothetical protein [Deltaproteobacteria bacterium]